MSDIKRGKALQNLVKFLLKENIDNSFEIAKLHSIIHHNVKMKRKQRKKFKKETIKLLDKINENVKIYKKLNIQDEKK